MQSFISLAQIDEVTNNVRSRISIQPVVGLILGSGLNGLADSVQNPIHIPYSDLPNFPTSTVHGHVGRFVIGELEGKAVIVMQGRIHYYEGYTMGQVTLPVRGLALSGPLSVMACHRPQPRKTMGQVGLEPTPVAL